MWSSVLLPPPPRVFLHKVKKLNLLFLIIHFQNCIKVAMLDLFLMSSKFYFPLNYYQITTSW